MYSFSFVYYMYIFGIILYLKLIFFCMYMYIFCNLGLKRVCGRGVELKGMDIELLNKSHPS